jgi:hypothetical protein
MQQRKPSSSQSKSSKPKLLSEQQIRTIICETFPGRDGVPDAQIQLLLRLVNNLLIQSIPRVAVSSVAHIEKLYSSLHALRTVLAEPLLKEHLIGIGRAVYLNNLMSGRGGTVDGGDAVQEVRDSVENLSDGVDRAIDWLKEQRVVNAYIGSTKSKLKRSDMERIGLPLIYEAVFGLKCGISRNGPGLRFVFGVLRAAGFRTEDEKSSAIEAIVKGRTRNKKKAQRRP